MGIIKKLVSYVTDSDYRFLYNADMGLHNYMSDEAYIKRKFKAHFKRELDLENPKTFNEKLQWLKLHYRKPEMTTMVDKVAAKQYVADIIGEKHIIPTLGVWKSFDEIDFDKLPNQFVLKCNHDCGGLVICKDKSKLNKAAAKKKIEKCLKNNFFWFGREWPYKNVEPQILCEEYITDGPDSEELTDYKFYCFDGHVDCVMVCYDRFSGQTKYYFFDKEWNLRRLNRWSKEAPEGFTLPKPEGMDEMFQIAEKLSKGMPFLRVDLYQSNGSIYFGELTIFSASGFDWKLFPETDAYWGEKLVLPEKIS